MAMTDITQNQLESLFSYDKETGIFSRKKSTFPNGMIIESVGCIGNHGYLVIGIFNRRYLAHRLAWIYVNGSCNGAYIDHINGIKTDNRIKNLRIATKSENGQNRFAAQKNGASKLLGVTWNKMTRSWRAKIQLNGKTEHIGMFQTAEEAHHAYLLRKREVHPFCNL